LAVAGKKLPPDRQIKSPETWDRTTYWKKILYVKSLSPGNRLYNLSIMARHIIFAVKNAVKYTEKIKENSNEVFYRYRQY
jgi:hypothetical protein